MLKAFECTSQTQSAFCLEHGLSISTLQYQLRRQRSGIHNPESKPPSTPELLEVTPISDGRSLPVPSPPVPANRSLRVELSLESRTVTVDCRPDQFAELLDGLSTFHDQREARR